MEMHGMARLAEIPTERAVTTLVPRDEIAGALADPAHSPELYLDVIRGEEEGTDRHQLVARRTRAQLLAEATGDDVVLTFDRDELQTIFDDVEAHGLREKGSSTPSPRRELSVPGRRSRTPHLPSIKRLPALLFQLCRRGRTSRAPPTPGLPRT